MKHHATLTIVRAPNGQLYAGVNPKNGEAKFYHVGTSTRSDALFLRPVSPGKAQQLRIAFDEEIREIAQGSLFPVPPERTARAGPA